MKYNYLLLLESRKSYVSTRACSKPLGRDTTSAAQSLSSILKSKKKKKTCHEGHEGCAQLLLAANAALRTNASDWRAPTSHTTSKKKEEEERREREQLHTQLEALLPTGQR